MLRFARRLLGGGATNYAQLTGRRGGVLFTAGPINTSKAVREAQLVDYGSRDSAFVEAVAEVRKRLLEVARVPAAEWSAFPLQGSGTMGVEASLATVIPRPRAGGAPGKVLVVCNGAYGSRMASIVERLGGDLVRFDVEEGKEIDLVAFQQVVMAEKGNLAVCGFVHCETSTGMFNPIHGLSRIFRHFVPHGTIVLDAMSSLGAVDFSAADVADVVVSSANKCLQGVPGFSIIVARRDLLQRFKGHSPSLTLDIAAQSEGLDKTGQFNYTPPVQAIMAFRKALEEHAAEGGTVARGERYSTIANYIADEMTSLGFELFLDRSKPSFGYIITAYKSPTHDKWDFKAFYSKLNQAGFVIYPGKASNADTFRIGSLGDITLEDAKALMVEVRRVLKEMDVDLLQK